MHIEAVGADAGLAGIAVLRRQRAFDRRIEIGIVEHDEGRVAAEFQRQLLDGRRALLHQDAADRRRAGERQVAHDRAAHSALPTSIDRVRIGGDDIDHARRHAGAVRQFRQRQRRQRRLLGRLDDDGAAGGERRARPCA